MLKLKLQYFGHLMQKASPLEKDSDAGKDWGQEKKGATEDEVVGWHHRLNGHEFEQTLGDGEGQGSLACCSPWDHKEADTTEWLNSSSSKLQSPLSYQQSQEKHPFLLQGSYIFPPPITIVCAHTVPSTFSGNALDIPLKD